jgi:hypothetical protein
MIPAQSPRYDGGWPGPAGWFVTVREEFRR